MSSAEPNLKHIGAIQDQIEMWQSYIDNVDKIQFVDAWALKPNGQKDKDKWPGELFNIMNEEIREGIKKVFIEKRDSNIAWVKTQMKQVVESFKEQLDDAP